ncbi:MAG: hypothetical protein V7750_13030 [Sneathiella sp.]
MPIWAAVLKIKVKPLFQTISVISSLFYEDDILHFEQSLSVGRPNRNGSILPSGKKIFSFRENMSGYLCRIGWKPFTLDSQLQEVVLEKGLKRAQKEQL